MAKLAEHLGGHANITHLDHGALNWAIEKFNVKTMLDIGCGPGGMVKLANETGLDAKGVDGDHTLKRYDESKFIIHDFTTGPVPDLPKYDLGWSVEFLEHVYEKFMPNYMPSFQACKIMIVTYAPPGWPGHHHVNCQKEPYWYEKFAEYGLEYDPDLTAELRRVSTMNKNNKRNAFVKNRGLIFKNTQV